MTACPAWYVMRIRQDQTRVILSGLGDAIRQLRGV